MTPELEQQPINTSGLKPETQMSAQPQPMETDGVSKALSILDKADQLKTAGAFTSPALALKSSRQVGTVSGVATGKGGSFGSKIPLLGTPKIKEPAMKPKLKLALVGMPQAGASRGYVKREQSKGGRIMNRVSDALQPVKLAAQSVGEGTLHRVKQIIRSRAETRTEADLLFDGAAENRAKEQKKADDLFVQSRGAETMAPMLVKGASVSPNVDAFFEKIASQEGLTEAQIRYPELLQVKR